ncbi:MAG: histidinol-phosphatase [Planctomycetes bacterium]|nr:histidinol-phosphatase [Planctomycetota bacterium]
MMTTPESSQLQSRLDFAVKIARLAGEQTLELFRTTDLEIIRKSDGSPVTAADRGAEQLLRDQIGQQFPEDAILGEEFGETTGTSGYRWVLDPIDGTKAFIAGVPLYTTLVAVMLDDEPKIGVIFAPAAREIVYAACELGCWHVIGDGTPQPARVSQVDNLAEAVVVTSSVKSFTTERGVDARPVFDQLQTKCRVTRTWGDAFGYLLVATGRAEVAIDPAMSLWDTAALLPVIEEAGGKFFDWQGRATVHNGESVATNPQLADRVLAIIQNG